MRKITKISQRTEQKDKVADDFSFLSKCILTLTSLSTVGQSAGTVLKHSWYFVRKKGNAKSEKKKEKKTVHEEKKKKKKNYE